MAGPKLMVTSSVLEVQPLLTVQRRVYVVEESPEKELVALLDVAIEPPEPLTTDQVPVPMLGLFPAKATALVLQTFNWSAPALAVVAVGRNETNTSSNVLEQALEIVQRKV